MNKYLKLLSLAVVLVMSVARCGGDDPVKKLPTLSINSAAGQEGEIIVFTVTLSEASTEVVQFNYSTSHGTTNASDFKTVNAPRPAIINPGVTSVEIPITLYADADAESSETFKVTLSDPNNAELSDTFEGTGTINNGPAPFFMKMKVDGEQWVATQDFLFYPSFSSTFGYAFAGYGDMNGAFYGSQVSFIFGQEPAVKTYGISLVDDDTHVKVYWSPDFLQMSGLGVLFLGQEGGEFVLTKYDVAAGEAEGTFSFTAKTDEDETVEVTEGQFRVKIE